MSYVAFGEVMMRLTPSVHASKIKTSNSFQVNYAGSESNVASSLGILGNKVAFVTKLPNNQLGDGAISSLKSFGINTDYVVRGGNRIGTYFIEIGSSIRPSSVIYDRRGSAISGIEDGELNWEEILKDKKWIFLSGITPVLSKQCALETINAARIAKKMGVKVAFDMNYRRSLWNDSSIARKIFDQILENTELLFGNAGVLKDVYNIQPEGKNKNNNTKNAASIASNKFGIPHVSFTIREDISASHNKVSAIYMTGSKYYESKIYDVSITDRFGTGDAFAAAFMHALNCKWNNNKVIGFAAAAFALKHSVQGDQHTSNEKEILSVMEGNIKGRVLR